RAASRVKADARKQKPDLQGNTRSTVVLLKASLAQHTLQRKRCLPQCVPPVGAHWLDEKKIPALEHDLPSLSNAEVQDKGWDDEEAAVGIDDISQGAALDFH